MGWESIIGGGAALLGQLITNEQNSDEASFNRLWQSDMANTQYQRAMVDMRAAGLNPILAAKLGGSAVGAGGQAVMGNLGAAVSTALDADRTKAQVNLNDASAWTQRSQKVLNEELTGQAIEQQRLTAQTAKTEAERTRREKYEADIAAENAKGRKVEGQIDEGDWGTFFRYLDRLRGTGSTIRNIRP